MKLCSDAHWGGGHNISSKKLMWLGGMYVGIS